MQTHRLLLPALAVLAYLSADASAGVMDNFNDGLRMAGQMFGINTAADVANLVAKAFSGAATSTRRKPDIMSVLQHGFQTQQQQQQEEQEEPPSEEEQSGQQSEPENAQELPPLQQNKRQPTRQRPAAELNTGQMLTNMLRMVGFDVRKLGALALNAFIMIAQAIGSSLLQATRAGGGLFGTTPSQPADHTGPEAVFEPNVEHQPRVLRPGTPIDWFLQRPNKQTERLLRQIMDNELPERIVDMIEQRESAEQADAGCLKLLMCKSSPIIWGMQKSLRRRLNVNATGNEQPGADAEQQHEQEQDEKGEEKGNTSFLNPSAFFKHLPSIDEFRMHGERCETRFASACALNQTVAHKQA